MARTLIVVAAFVAALGATAPWRQEAPRPVILLLHGRGMAGQDTAALRKFWYESLLSGAKAAKRDGLLKPTDVRLVWYADVLDPRSADVCDYSADDPRARRDAAVDPGFKSFVALVGGIFSALTSVVDDASAAVELRTLSADAAFLGDAHKRCATEARLGDAIDRAKRDGRPVILVAHSLGALVAYDHLSTRRDTGIVTRLVTVGSMLGSTELRRLLIGDDGAGFALPSSVASWINVRNHGDGLAVPLPFGEDIETDAPADEPDHHQMIAYLRNSVTADAILSGWCAAFTGQRPKGC